MERESMSIKITQEQKVYINKYIENLDELLKEGEINEVLIAIDDAIISTFDKDGYPDETGNKLRLRQVFCVNSFYFLISVMTNLWVSIRPVAFIPRCS